MAERFSAAGHGLIEELCTDFRSWLPEADAPPRLIRELPGGYSNRAVLLEGGGHRWVLRLPGPERAGVCRQRERRAVVAASERGLCPEVRLCEPARGLLITRYVASVQERQIPIAELAALLRAIHEIPWGDGENDVIQHPAETLQRESAALPPEHPLAPVLDRHRGRLGDVMEELAEHRAQPVLCHNDLLRGNRLRTQGGLLAIDWEYAGGNAALFDIAVCASETREAEPLGMQLLEHYLGRSPQRTELRQLMAWQLLYRALEALWYARHAAASPRAAAARLQLESELARRHD